MAECMIPPWVLPESPETIRMIDDATLSFAPAFGRGMTQRGVWADPRWGLHRRYRGLRSEQKAAIQQCLNESRGQLNKILVTPHTPLRGSFPTTELLSNPTFASGTTGWTSSSEYTLSVSDRVLRAARNAMTTNQYALRTSADVTVSQYVVYVMRFMTIAGRGDYTANGLRIDDSSATSPQVGTTVFSHGLLTQAFVSLDTSMRPSLVDPANSGFMADDYLLVPYASMARGALVDNGANAATKSDQIDDSTWIKTKTTVSANADVGYDGTSTADRLIEDNTAGFHSATQQLTRASAAEDWCVYGYFKRAVGTRDVQLDISSDSAGANSAFANFRLSDGVVTSSSVTGTATNVRAVSVDKGNGWYFCAVVGTFAASAQIRIDSYMLSSGTGSYTGDNASAIAIKRFGAARSGTPLRGDLTTTSALASGTAQSGGGLYLKGLPASTSGLLEIGDWFEVAGQLKQATVRLNSDAAGLGYVQFRPALGTAPADNDPVVIGQPFGRFIYPQGTRELSNLFGIYVDCEMDLEEIYA